jgi:hypothetical protein
MMNLNRLMKLADKPHTLEVMRSVVFDGRNAVVMADFEWAVGIPCPQPQLLGLPPVVVPARTLKIQMHKGKDLVVHPDRLINSRGLETAMGAGPRGGDAPPLKDYAQVLDLLPKPPAGEPVGFDLELNALDRVLVAAGKQDIRNYLNGVLMDLTNGVLVGSDGHRLHLYRNRVPELFPLKREDGAPVGKQVELIVPRDPLMWLLDSQDTHSRVTVWNAGADASPGVPGSEPQFLLQTSDAFVWVKRPLAGRFPDWGRVLPSEKTRPVWATLDPVQVADTALALQRVGRLAGRKMPSVWFDLQHGRMVADVPAQDSMPMAVALDSNRPGFDAAGLVNFGAGLQCPYLADVADCVTPAARWSLDECNAPNQALLVVDGDFSGVVMTCLLGVEVAPPEPVAVACVSSIDTEVPEPEQVGDADVVAEPELEPEPEPCPAAVASVAAQLLGHVQDLAKATRKAGKTSRKAEPVAA